MTYKLYLQRFLSVLTAAVLALTLLLPAASVYAAERQYITDIRVDAGEDAVDRLESDDFSVMMTGLNSTVYPQQQVYLAYRKDSKSAPVTNIIVSTDGGDSLKDENGITYTCAGKVDADAGLGAGAGYLYFTRDKKAGDPLVGLDILRSKDEALYPITNDGAEIVRHTDGTPADLETVSDDTVIYLAQIRDNIVRPYISEIGVVTDEDKWNAVYTACERGYNYYVEGDIDNAEETYTIIVYKRTADVNAALTNIAAVSAEAVKAMEEAQTADEAAAASEKLTGDTIGISGVEYVRVSSQAIAATIPYYLYQTKNTAAGNPVSMLYAEALEAQQNMLLGTWADGYFSNTFTSASAYTMEEELFAVLREDLTVCTNLPVKFLDKIPSGNSVPETTTQATTEAATEATTQAPTEPAADEEAGEETEEVSEETTQETTEETTEETTQATTEAPTEAPTDYKMVGIVMLTPRDGLPESVYEITGLRANAAEQPVEEQTQRTARTNKFQASVFGKGAALPIALGCAVIVAAGVSIVVIRKKKSDKAR